MANCPPPLALEVHSTVARQIQHIAYAGHLRCYCHTAKPLLLFIMIQAVLVLHLWSCSRGMGICKNVERVFEKMWNEYLPNQSDICGYYSAICYVKRHVECLDTTNCTSVPKPKKYKHNHTNHLLKGCMHVNEEHP